MARSPFKPEDPQAVHERFERVKARALKRLDDELRQIKRMKPATPELRRTAPRSNRRGT
jgi:hypothetical protein